MQGRAIVGKFLAQKVSRDVPGTYVPPFYQLSGVAVAEVCDCITFNHHCKLLIIISHCITE